VVGFSQGAALTNLLLLLYPQRIHRAGVLAGFMPGGTDQLIQSQPLNGKSVFVAHGTQDQMVSIERAQQEISLLEEAGAQVSFCEAEVAHKVSADCLRALQSFFYAN
jgi:phospholipase/carboxylesterase